MDRKKIAILGSTGSIGRQALDILSDYPEYYEISALSSYQNIDLLYEQVKRYKPSRVAIIDNERAKAFRKRDLKGLTVLSGETSLIQLIEDGELDIVLVAVVGIAGLRVTLAALEAGIDVALANKETLVAGGQLVIEAAQRTGSHLIPVDSEHSAIFQCFRAASKPQEINKIYLTASGGPFRGFSRNKLKQVSVDDALKHPNWDMGKKITVDSSTLMNKGLEVIEAKWLFDLSVDQIDVLIHPQSIIHSMVEFVDGSIIAQMGKPDMRIPILYAFSYPERFSTKLKKLDFLNIPALSFEEPDIESFPSLSLAYKALKIGGTMPTVLNAANEVAVQKFLQTEISFLEIPVIVERAMKSHEVISNPTIDDVLRVDKKVRDELV